MNIKNYLAFKVLLLMIPGFLLFVRCTQPVKDYIPGVYTAEWTTEFTEARDTFAIENSVRQGSGIYQITRRIYMLYQKKPQYKLVHWTGTYNNTNKTIIVNKNGRILSFDPANNEMKMGSTTYKKL